MTNPLGDIAQWVTGVIEALGYGGVAFLVALENVIPPIPSEVVLPLAGFLAGQGRFNLPLLVLAATVGSVIGALIVAHAVFVFFEANPTNPLVEFTASIRDSFGWFTKDLFQPDDAKIGDTINDALAALIWVVGGNLVSKLIVRLAPTSSARA